MTAETRRALQIADTIKPMLRGLGPDLQGAVLAELVSLWQAGHRPDLREEVLNAWLDTMRDLTRLNSATLWGEHWDKPQ